MKQIKSKYRKILILGASGFVGRSLIEYYLKHNLRTSHIYSISRKEFRIKNKSSILYKQINKNILDVKKFPQIDLIFYLIKANNIKQSKKYFIKFKNLLGMLKTKPKILYFSSGAVYGNIHKKSETKESITTPNKNINYLKGYKKEYALEKIYLEDKFKELSFNDYKISVVRGFTFLGKHILNYNYAISGILKAINLNKSIELYNNNTFRSYMHSDDMCRWMIKIIDSSSKKINIYNLGSDKILNLRNLCKFLSKKYRTKFIYKRNIKNKVDFYVPNTNLAKKKLNLSTKINFENAIELSLGK